MKKARQLLHYAITAFLLLGGVFTKNKSVLRIHIVVDALVLLHWLSNNNKCFLSDIDYSNNQGYSNHLMSLVGFDNISDDTANFMSYASVIIAMLYSYGKLIQP